MTPSQFIAFMQNLTAKGQDLNSATNNMLALITRVNRTIDRTDTLSLPLSQTDVDRILQVQTPVYNNLKAALLAAYNALP